MRRFKVVAIVLAAVLVLGCLGIYRLGRETDLSLPVLADSCRAVGSDDHVVKIKPQQLDNAATIAAVGARLGMEPRAVTVALATAYQESKLRNLTRGDRDSVGLFQQRPSMGWGSAADLNRPRYAAERFYRALATVPDWQNMRIAEAAQAVQKSAHPEAYAKWEPNARTLASTLLGEQSGSVTCRLRDGFGTGVDDPLGTVSAELVADAGPLDVAREDNGVVVQLGGAETAAGWRTALWFVAKSRTLGIRDVSFAGQRWTAKSGAWKSSTGADSADTVQAQLG